MLICQQSPSSMGLLSTLSLACCCNGKNVINTGRKIIEATNHTDSAPGTIRGSYAIDIGRNIIHGSHAVESARKEIALWFPKELQNGAAAFTHGSMSKLVLNQHSYVWLWLYMYQTSYYF